MAIFRINKTKDYSVMSNYHFKNRNLSLKAKGLLSLMLSLPDDWDFTEEGLTVLCSDGLSSVRSAIKELESAGHIVRKRKVDGKGKFKGIQYDIYEKPLCENPKADNPILEKPKAENRTQLNTNKLNTDLIKNESIIYIVGYLNERAETNYKPNTPKTQTLIKARLNEGFTVEDFKTVIDKKVKEWESDEKMCKYLRPETLFGTKFEAYLNQRERISDYNY